MNLRKTKIICTVGPASDSEKMLMKMFNAGMNVARLNLSNGGIAIFIFLKSPCLTSKRIARIRTASSKTNKYVGIMLDTKGPEIRVGIFENDACSYEQGDHVYLVNEEVIGNKERFYVNCPEFFEDINIGNEILIDDGKISLTVVEKEEGKVKCVINNSCTIKNKKGKVVETSIGFSSKSELVNIIKYNEIKLRSLNVVLCVVHKSFELRSAFFVSTAELSSVERDFLNLLRWKHRLLPFLRQVFARSTARKSM